MCVCYVGVVMTNSTFTSGTIQLAATPNALLWDRQKLDEIISKVQRLVELKILAYAQITMLLAVIA